MGGKYFGLSRLLETTEADSITLTFAEVEAFLGFALPASARRHQAWWSNSEHGHSHARAWLSVGWRTSGVSIHGQRVTFVRATRASRRSAPAEATLPAVYVPYDPAVARAEALISASPPHTASRASADRRGRVGLVGCVKKKQSYPAPAEDLYTSPLFRGRRAYVEQTCERWLVLSALHGVVKPGTVLDPYDVTLNDASISQRQAWAEMVLRQLDAELGSCRGLTFEVHAGANYADYGLMRGLKARGAKVEQPAHGLKMGEQLAFYSRGPAVLEAYVVSADGDEPSTTMPVAADTTAAPDCRPQDVQDALAALDQAPRLVRGSDWPLGVDCLESSGLYVWWVDERGAADLSSGLDERLEAGRIYIGQAGATFWPSGKVSDNNLGKRIGQMHLNGRVRGSTFRFTLASILFSALGIQVRGPMVITPQSEEDLSAWMREHLSVAVHPQQDRDTLESVERQLLTSLDPPLNLRHMPPTAPRVRLTELRKRISRDF